MIICHIAPFAPNRAGIYEAARDMARADIVGGNEVIFIDAGVTVGGEREAPQVGAVDNRAGFNLVTGDPKLINDADIIIMHTGAPDEWIVKNQAPLIWAVHGRPLASFRPEQTGDITSYSLYKMVADWPRSKKMLYFWPEFQPHWNHLFNGKDLVLNNPVIDETRFNIEIGAHKLENPGKINLLVCDSSREDIDLYEMTVGLIEASKQIEGLKVHFYGHDHINQNCWQLLFNELKRLGTLGDLQPRVSCMEQVFRGVDCLISPNRIITRTIGESLSCGTPVIAQNGCKVADYVCDMADPSDVVEAIKLFVNDFEKGINREHIFKHSYIFNMGVYAEKMNAVYKELLG